MIKTFVCENPVEFDDLVNDFLVDRKIKNVVRFAEVLNTSSKSILYFIASIEYEEIV